MHASPSIPQSATKPEVDTMELAFSDMTYSLVDGDMVRIGASEICEIQLADGPPLHSVIHCEDGVVWIEADADADDLLINGRSCRRMALREQDVINACGLEMTLQVPDSETSEKGVSSDVGDVTQMSAEQLCDRIMEERAEVAKLESTRLEGWHNLMTAIKSVHESDEAQVNLPAPAEPEESSEACERLLDQIREMSEMVNGRSLELDDCESELLAATALLHETQDRITRQIEELLDQISDCPFTNTLRASA